MPSLEQLLQAASNPANSGPDTAAIDRFCERVNVEPDGALLATRLLAAKIQSSHEWEALQALHILEHCVRTCPSLLPEVAKFRFLNELIRVVSPKYLGPRTAPAIKSRVLEMLFGWTRQYPQETKIQDAFDMLRKQGVVTDDHMSSPCAVVPPRPSDKTSVFEDDEKSKLLKRLLQSKHPDDLQAANRLIKSMVREDEKRTERQCKATSKVEQVQNNCQLLMEMLTHYNKSGANTADLELMSELKQTCETLRPTLSNLAEECADQEEILNDIISAGEELSRVLDIYTAVILRGEKLPLRTTSAGASLLDLGQDEACSVAQNNKSDADQLKEIFSSAGMNSVAESTPMSAQLLDGPLLMDAPIMGAKVELGPRKANPSLMTGSADFISSPTTVKVEKKPHGDPLKGLDLDFLVQAQMTEGLQKKQKKISTGDDAILDFENANHGDDSLLDFGKSDSLPDLEPLNMDGPPETNSKIPADILNLPNVNTVSKDVPKPEKPPTATVEPQRASEEPPIDCKALLANLTVSLTEVRPSRIPPVVVLDQPEGLHVSLHVAQNCPRPGVRVVVVSIQSRLAQPLDSLVCQCVVPSKACKVRLQPPSASELPAFSPFLPPPAVTQLMLLANPKEQKIGLKLMLSYCVDGDLVTEMGEVEHLPFEGST
ncbi:ADP-ribosylation factor-binding protein GGA3 [Neocloeon triangulifer]|uniref:ADP-ribosylation factor-binding protein GGA3 n=1 Tax=Neocloeon triangulifer TaxID=2078957 RepID=UPI00286F5CA8|nr:ADP-ribosylation factor-binding protein GGA3 [Neocloeon triangulifer]